MTAYHADNGLAGTQQAMTSAYKTLLEGLTAAGLKRARIFKLKVGQSAAPASADCEVVYDISRITATGTGTAITPNPTEDPGACTSTWKANDTVEPTVTAISSIDGGGGNQRTVFAWATTDKSQMLPAAGTSGQGLAIRAKSSGYTGTMEAALDFDE